MENPKIDFILPWVDGNDPVWREKKQKYAPCDDAVNSDARYRDWETLKYWFRGVEKFAPWVGNIYFVTDGQKPEWLNTDHPKLKWVKHSDYIPQEYLPTFNSNTILLNLHRIEGLSENFVLLNDDVFFINKLSPNDFFVNGLPCDCPRLWMPRICGDFTHTVVNNYLLMNRHFSLGGAVKANLKPWLMAQSPCFMISYGLLGRKMITPVFHDWHLQNSYCKSVFEKLWNEEFDILNKTCLNKVRSAYDVTDWCVRYWQLYSNNFHYKKPTGKYFESRSVSKNDKLLKYISGQKGKTVCINDTEDEKNFEAHKQLIINEFEKLFPEKSAFEL